MIERLKRMPFDVLQQCAKSLVHIHLISHQQRIHKQTGHVVQLMMRPCGGGRAHNDIVLP
ncbi:hypothetical protein D3C81_2060520 [compost metagenome]